MIRVERHEEVRPVEITTKRHRSDACIEDLTPRVLACNEIASGARPESRMH
jgi:hypothetical protein